MPARSCWRRGSSRARSSQSRSPSDSDSRRQSSAGAALWPRRGGQSPRPGSTEQLRRWRGYVVWSQEHRSIPWQPLLDDAERPLPDCHSARIRDPRGTPHVTFPSCMSRRQTEAHLRSAAQNRTMKWIPNGIPKNPEGGCAVANARVPERHR